MTRVIILHGTGSSPDYYWHPYIREKLENMSCKVSVPTLPNSSDANIREWLPLVLGNEKIDENTILIGHSSGCALILSILENVDCKIKQAILVSGFIDTIESKVLQESYDWEKIKANVGDIIFINSDDDPWGCNDSQGRKMFDKLGGTMIVRHGEGHMGSMRFKQPYREFPFLLGLIDID